MARRRAAQQSNLQLLQPFFCFGDDPRSIPARVGLFLLHFYYSFWIVDAVKTRLGLIFTLHTLLKPRRAKDAILRHEGSSAGKHSFQARLRVDDRRSFCTKVDICMLRQRTLGVSLKNGTERQLSRKISTILPRKLSTAPIRLALCRRDCALVTRVVLA